MVVMRNCTVENCEIGVFGDGGLSNLDIDGLNVARTPIAIAATGPVRDVHIRRLVHTPDHPILRQKIGRNDPCWCGSGKKFKRCCMP